MTELRLVAALDRRRAIGRDNDLPWRLPADLKRFKALTLGHPLLMGRRTAESLGRALPGRLNLVLTRQGKVPFEGMHAVPDIDAALGMADGASDLMVIGGGEVYALCLPLATHLHLTHVDTEVEGADAFFPAFDPADWDITSDAPQPADDRHAFPYRFVDYRRR